MSQLQKETLSQGFVLPRVNMHSISWVDRAWIVFFSESNTFGPNVFACFAQLFTKDSKLSSLVVLSTLIVGSLEPCACACA